jgi:molybdopterin-guanine dinucleotide biosynthesis protein A
LDIVAEPIVVVLAPDQTLPADMLLPNGRSLVMARDARPDRGPLEGMSAGLAALGDRADLVYATTCDAPLLEPAFAVELARRLALAGDEVLAAAPVEEQFHHPLATVYRPAILSTVNRLLAADLLRPTLLFDEAPSLRVPVDELRAVDPDLHTLWNLNSPEEYNAALRAAEF